MTDASDDVICEEQGRAGFIRLNRPRALNAVTHGMIGKLEAFTQSCAASKRIYGIVMEGEGKAFSAGGDIRAIHENGRSQIAAMRQYYAEEYQHNWTLEQFRKPHVALIDGVVMGGGVGICIYGTHRIGGRNFRFAMPETGIGFFPDIGGGWFLPRLPGKVGMYLGLTGKIVGQADAFDLGLLTHCIEKSDFEDIKSAMREGEPIDPVVERLHKQPDIGELRLLRPVIDRLFSGASLKEIFAALSSERGEHEAFAASTMAILRSRSPLSLRVTFEQLRHGHTYANLKEALAIEYRLASRFLQEPDLYEGIRAVIIDKDQAPKWDAASIDDVSDERVAAFFAPLPEGELQLVDL